MVNRVLDHHLFSYLRHKSENQFLERALNNRAIFCLLRCGNQFIPNHSPIVAKLTTAMELAAAAEQLKPKVTLPPEYERFKPVFSKEATASLPPSRPYDHEINLNDTFIPKIGKLYPLTPEERQATEAFIDEHLASGKIRPSNSPQASPFFIIKKKDSGLSPCQDYQYINEHTVHDAYPLPLISELIDKLQGAKIFTKFNVRWGYNNFRIKDGHQWKAAFVTHRGLFKPTVIRIMNLNLHLKLEKCTFTTTEVEYLGMVVCPGQLAMDPVKLDGIAKWPKPTKVKDVRSFLGFANFYRRFISDYSNVARPLIDLTKKNLPWTWTDTHDAAFHTLKSLFLTKPILQLPDPSCPFALSTDTSKHASGTILLQMDANGNWHPCSYLSQSFSPAERNYDIYDRELLAIIHALKTWRHYLHGSPFPVQIFTNHKNLTFFRSPQRLNCCQAPWLLDLVDFDLQLTHVPDSHLAGPDALSCRPNLLPPSNTNNEGVTLLPPSLFVHVINSALSSHIASSSSSNPLVLQALQSMDGSISPTFCSCLSDWQHTNGILTYKGHVYIPPAADLHCDILCHCHDHSTAGHPGFLKTRQLVAADFWWPGLALFAHAYVAGCSTCQQHKVNTHPSTPPLHPIPSSYALPFHQISCNLITDLPVSSSFDSLLVVVDHGLSKGVILCPTKKTVTAEGIASLFFHKSSTTLDYTQKSSPIMDPNSPPNLPRNLDASSNTIFPSLLPITCKLMEKLNE